MYSAIIIYHKKCFVIILCLPYNIGKGWGKYLIICYNILALLPLNIKEQDLEERIAIMELWGSHLCLWCKMDVGQKWKKHQSLHLGFIRGFMNICCRLTGWRDKWSRLSWVCCLVSPVSPSSVPTIAFVVYCILIEHLIQAPHLLGAGGLRGQDPNLFWPFTHTIKLIPPIPYQALERHLNILLPTTRQIMHR